VDGSYSVFILMREPSIGANGYAGKQRLVDHQPAAIRDLSFAMSEFLFAYGTLQPGLAPKQMEPVVARMRVVGEGFVYGWLYNLGHFPGLQLDPAGRKVFGTVMELPEDFLPELDAYEEFYADALEASQFLRVRQSVKLKTGEQLECWVFVYNRAVGNAPLIPDGRFCGDGLRLVELRAMREASAYLLPE
jgi:gamma-glutamylcyclotransferase (GGCT)/AIG2-like uncharacterized protein YtfP